MTAEQKIHKAIKSCQKALKELEDGNMRISVGDLDFADEFITAAKWLLITEIEDEEGKL